MALFNFVRTFRLIRGKKKKKENRTIHFFKTMSDLRPRKNMFVSSFPTDPNFTPDPKLLFFISGKS